MTNAEIRTAAMQIGETTLCRRMRTEMQEAEKREILKIIERLSKEVS